MRIDTEKSLSIATLGIPIDKTTTMLRYKEKVTYGLDEGNELILGLLHFLSEKKNARFY